MFEFPHTATQEVRARLFGNDRTLADALREEGWITPDEEYCMRIFKMSGYNISATYFQGNNVYLPIPRTLDDFINDVNRAGIELTWKTNTGE